MSGLSLPFRLPAPVGGPVDVLIIAGEHSGDEHAARLVREFCAEQPGAKVAALGGPELAAAGAQLLYDLTASSVVGIVEVLKNYSFFKALMEDVLRWIGEHRPRAVLFVDYPGMNLRLAAALRERGLSVKGGGTIKTLFYISPQIWAWKAKRRFTMARDLDALAVIFPFEVACYADTTLPVDFVGHPFLAADYVPPVRYDPSGPILLLPGSRKQAVGRIFPMLLAGYAEFLRGGGDRDAVAVYPSEEIVPAARGSAFEAGEARADRHAGLGCGCAHLERDHVDALCAGGHPRRDRLSGEFFDLSAWANASEDRVSRHRESAAESADVSRVYSRCGDAVGIGGAITVGLGRSGSPEADGRTGGRVAGVA